MSRFARHGRLSRSYLSVMLVFLSILLVLGTSIFLHFFSVQAEEDTGIDVALDANDVNAAVKRTDYDLPSDSGTSLLFHSFSSSTDPICDDCGYIRIVEITGLDAPVAGQTLDTSVTTPVSAACYVSVTWSPADTVAKSNTAYTATITITPKSGYSFKTTTRVTVDNVAVAFTISPSGALTVTRAYTSSGTPDPGTTTPVPGTTTPAPITIQPIAPAPVPAEPDPASPIPDPTSEPSFEDFIERLYVVALDRKSEPDGKAFWMDKVMNEGFSGGRCAYGFLVEAQEFLNRDLSDEQFVEVLYMTFFDRASDEGGKAFWLEHLQKDMTRAQVVNGFIDSVEWCNLCASYGVKSGAPNAKAENASKNAIKFATRLYTECLGREYDESGLQFWALRLTNLESSGYEAALGFFTSDEFKQQNVSDDEFIHRLYRTFMGRDEDADGFAFWKSHLGTDMSREDLIKGFAQSQEFTNICNQYGIDKGTL